jgi:hypothetical protein
LGLCVRTYLCTFDRILCAAFDLALVSSTAAPQPAHTHARCVRPYRGKSDRARPAQHTLRHACGRTYPVSSNAKPVAPLAPGTSASTTLMCGRTYSSWAFRDLLLGHFSPISPSFFLVGRTPLHSPFSIPPPKSLPKHPNHRRPTTPRPIAGLSPTSPPTAGRPLAGFSSFPIFLPENPFFSNSSIFFFQFFLWIVGSVLFVVGFMLFVQGVGLF